ncbi:MAG: hypothetical protein NTY30_02710 [Candidatus Berkelbacteria bacterium]|nr:hypothetical protein [Candidatus Berkelbacteria bacterium]
MNKKVLIWMNCYGAWDPESRHKVETTGYDQYLNTVVKKISTLKNRIAAFWISGGMYDSLHRTECETVKPELKKRFDANNINLEISTDEDSITSAMIMKKFLQVWKDKYFDCEPIIFVDQVRYEINKYTFEHYCKELGIKKLEAEKVIIPVERLDIHPNSTPEFQSRKLTLMKEKGVEYVEELEKEVRKEHLKK